ncbi:MAG: 2Fe-2S iron-sulfur cluster binding domain-containing protein [Saprospiraceae bacterium]|nr:2Fe-2S iron-sulfur cluster binding domain-containing protein [Saprospiraceae bacterium]
MNFHSLKISKIVSETLDTVSITFETPSNIKEEFTHHAGQYLTLRTTINGKEIRRAYSICTPPDAPNLTVTVKKVKNGLMSSYLTEKIKVGDYIDVMTPEGLFVTKPDHTLARTHYFFAAGSGITPIMSMIQSVIEHEPKSVCYLLYGSRDEQSIIFKAQLESLSIKYADQLYVSHILSQPIIRKEGGIAGLFAKKITDWQGFKGRIDPAICAEFFSINEPKHTERQYYICGPGDFIEKLDSYLQSRHIEKKYIHKEYFTSGSTEKPSDSGVSKGLVNITLKGETFDIVVPKGKTILDVLVEAKKDPPYSCTSGACSTCLAKVTEGEVKMDSCYALEEDEVAAGYILTCQSHPITEKVVLTFDM